MRRRVLFSLVAALIAALGACVGENPTAGPAPGTAGGPCNDGRCLTGLACVASVCSVQGSSEAGAPATDSAAALDATSSEDAGNGEAGTCPRASAYVAQPIQPPPPPVNVCPTATLAEVIAACVPSIDNPPCKDAQEDFQSCTRCIFTSSTAPQWGPVVVSASATPASRYNHAACIDALAGRPGCGAEYMYVRDCVVHRCGGCDTSSAGACVDEAPSAACRHPQATLECTAVFQNRREEIESTCFAADGDLPAQQALFRRLATQLCAFTTP